MNCSKENGGMVEMVRPAETPGKLKEWMARLAYRFGAFLLIRTLHHRWYGPGIRILFYHRVSRDVEAFRRHLDHLRRFYQVISLGEAAQAFRQGNKLPRNAVVITFDDGYRDNYTVALPLLRNFGLTATIFVVTSAIDGTPLWFDEVRRWFMQTAVASLRFGEDEKEWRLGNSLSRVEAACQAVATLKNLPGEQFLGGLQALRCKLKIPARPSRVERDTLTWDELREMAASGTFTVGAHTVTHPILPNLGPERIALEIHESCQTVSRELGRQVFFFAYPNGDFNPAAQEVVRELGLVACSVGGSGFNPPGADLTALCRLGAEGLLLFRFALYVAGWEEVAGRLGRSVRQMREAFANQLRIIGLRRQPSQRRLVVVRLRSSLLQRLGQSGQSVADSVDQFRRQVLWLSQTFTPISFDQLCSAIEGRATLPARPVLVTLDATSPNLLRSIVPALLQVGARALVFVPFGPASAARGAREDELEARLLNSPVNAVKIPVVGGEFLWLRTREERTAAFEKLRTMLGRLKPEERARARTSIEAQLPWPDGNEPSAEVDLTEGELRAFARQGVAFSLQLSSDFFRRAGFAEQAVMELRQARSELEARLGVLVASCSYAADDAPSEVGELLEKAGLLCAFTNSPRECDLKTGKYALGRVTLGADCSFQEFVGALSSSWRAKKDVPAKILEISNYPPPFCGWAMQTKQLVEELRRRGAACEVMNINESRRLKSPEYVDVQNGLDYLFKLLKFSIRGYRFHTHVNAESKKGYLLALSAHLVGRAFFRPAVMTFHGGLPQTYFPRVDSRPLRWAYRLLFLTAGSITSDNAQMCSAIQSYGINGRPIVPFPCFSATYLNFEAKKLPWETESFLQAHQPVFFCYVSFRPEYALPELLEAAKRFTENSPQAGFILLGFPSKEVPHAQAFLDSLPGGRPANLLLLGNLDHDLFLTLLKRCVAYIRPAACDGISSSVLESLALGVPVIAAENGRRPAGVVTYRFADPADLCDKLCFVVSNYDAVKRATRLEAADDYVGQAAEWLLRQEGVASVS